MTATEKYKRAEALFNDRTKRELADMVVHREADLEDARAENEELWASNERMGLKAMAAIGEVQEENERLKSDNAKLRKLAVGMYGMLEMVDKMLGNHDACETPRPLIFGEDKSFKDVMRELSVEVDA